MRGLEEIKSINENPGEHYASREPQHFGPGSGEHNKPTNDTLARILGEITGKQPQANDKQASEDAVVGLLAACAILDLLGVPAPTMSRPRTLADRPRQHADARAHLGMEGILSAIDAKPPFLTFWQNLNAERAARAEPEAGYGLAKEAFNGGPTPVGALTFIGKDFDGLRAVPSHPVQGKKSYHGEFRQTAGDGSTVWRAVASQAGLIEYTTPEAALSGARHARIHSEHISKH